jgi:hypothetical protein
MIIIANGLLKSWLSFSILAPELIEIAKEANQPSQGWLGQAKVGLAKPSLAKPIPLYYASPRASPNRLKAPNNPQHIEHVDSLNSNIHHINS